MTTEPTQVDGDLEVAFDPEPFLKITGTFPEPDGRVSTVHLEMNIGDQDLAEVDDEGEDGGPVRSWFTDFVTAVIASMRRQPGTPALMLTGSGVASFLADRMRHAEDCDGSCGQILPTVRPATPGAAEAAQAGGE